MTDKEIIIDGIKLEDIKNLLFTGQKMAISTKTFEAMADEIENLTQECEELKKYIEANKATGICETCTHKALQENDQYKQALDKVYRITSSLKYYIETPKTTHIILEMDRILNIVYGVLKENMK